METAELLIEIEETSYQLERNIIAGVAPTELKGLGRKLASDCAEVRAMNSKKDSNAMINKALGDGMGRARLAEGL